MGSQTFGARPDGGPTGAMALGEPDEDDPLRGALLFGNDPDGNPRGSEAVGGDSRDVPLRGALLFGNDPEGNPRGSEAVGGESMQSPLRGALLFGNDPAGDPRGASSFGSPDLAWEYRGSLAFGAPQGISDRLGKDRLGYDFVGTLLVPDEGTLAGVRKAPMDRLRNRILNILCQRLAVDPLRLRHGLGEAAMKWRRLRRDRSLDLDLGELLRRWFSRAPGDVLGIDQTRVILEDAERMHTFAIRGAWTAGPLTFEVTWDGEVVGQANTRLHQQHRYFAVTSWEGTALGYADDGGEVRRLRGIGGETLGTVTLSRDTHDRLQGELRDAQGRSLLKLAERPAGADRHLVELSSAGDGLGRLSVRRDGGRVEASWELDLLAPHPLVWGLGAVLLSAVVEARESKTSG